MAVVEISVVPLGIGTTSVSKYVAACIDVVANSNLSYQLTPMGTVIEASSMKEALSIIELAYEQVSDCERVYSSLKFDIRKNCNNRLKTKIESVEKVLNRKVNH